MEAAQDGVNFLFGVIGIVRKSIHNKVQDDKQFISHGRNLLQSSISIEEVLQHFANVLLLFLFGFKGGTLPFELLARQRFNGFLIQVLDTVRFGDHVGMDQKGDVIEHILYGEV